MEGKPDHVGEGEHCSWRARRAGASVGEGAGRQSWGVASACGGVLGRLLPFSPDNGAPGGSWERGRRRYRETLVSVAVLTAAV